MQLLNCELVLEEKQHITTNHKKTIPTPSVSDIPKLILPNYHKKIPIANTCGGIVPNDFP